MTLPPLEEFLNGIAHAKWGKARAKVRHLVAVRGIETTQELLELTEWDIMATKGIGRSTLNAAAERFEELGHQWPTKRSPWRDM